LNQNAADSGIPASILTKSSPLGRTCGCVAAFGRNIWLTPSTLSRACVAQAFVASLAPKCGRIASPGNKASARAADSVEPDPTIGEQRLPCLKSKEGADVSPRDLKSTESRELDVNVHYSSSFDPGLILLAFIVVCTAYELVKLY
jgi:hypothetical protein